MKFLFGGIECEKEYWKCTGLLSNVSCGSGRFRKWQTKLSWLQYLPILPKEQIFLLT